MRGPVYLRAPTAEDRDAFIAAARASAALHTPYVTAPSTSAQFPAYLRKMGQPAQYPYLVCRTDTDELAGVINLTNVVLGPFRSGYLGYYAFVGQAGRGFMRAGLKAVVTQAFGALKLHRLEANIQPGNRASIALVRGCGFQKEGYSPRYLKIRGRWRDHERWALLAS